MECSHERTYFERTKIMKITISGISGFLGANLALFFSEENEVTGISTSTAVSKFKVYDFKQLEQIAKPDVIIHCHAAVASGNLVLDQETLFRGNVQATEQIVNHFPDAAHLYISSASIYGNAVGTIQEKSSTEPLSAYAISKLWGENIVLKAKKSAVLRLSSLYGNGMKENTLIPNYTNQAIKNHQIEVWGKGERKQNYFHVSDAALLVEAIIKKNDWNQQIYLGTSDKEYSNLEIAKIIAAETQSEIIFKNNDYALSVHYNNSFTQNSLNWQPQTTIAAGLKQYTAWKKRQS